MYVFICSYWQRDERLEAKIVAAYKTLAEESGGDSAMTAADDVELERVPQFMKQLRDNATTMGEHYAAASNPTESEHRGLSSCVRAAPAP